MKKILFVCVLVFSLMVSPCFAIQYSMDILEPGNPGGWVASLKTFDVEWTMGPGDEITAEIWLSDVPESLESGGCIIGYDPSLVKVTNVIPYDDANGGPWDAEWTWSEQDQLTGNWFLSLRNFSCVEPDGDGDIILAKVTFKVQKCGDMNITTYLAGGLGLVIDCYGYNYDEDVSSNTVIIHHTILDSDDDGVCNALDNCINTDNGPDAGTCIVGTIGSDCRDDFECYYPFIGGDCSLDQEDADVDGVGDVCDNCPDTPNGPDAGTCTQGFYTGFPCSDDDECRLTIYEVGECSIQQDDNDLDGVGDVCDNCPYHANTDQDNWDNDALGDTCDCSDNLMGPLEHGADCGGICPDQCERENCYVMLGIKICRPGAVPVIYNGDPQDKIDIIFIPDEAYDDDFIMFRDDIRHQIFNVLFQNSIIKNNRHKINFWYSPVEILVGPNPNDGNLCSYYSRDGYYNQVNSAFGENYGILHLQACGDNSNGDYGFFTSWHDSVDTFIHEAGHNVFHLADEYDADWTNCSTDYFQPKPHANIFSSMSNCTAALPAGSTNPTGCEKFTDCEGGYYKSKISQPDGYTIMDCDHSPCFDWGDDAEVQVNWVFDVFGTANPSFSSIELDNAAYDPGNRKAIVIEMHYDGSSMVLNRSAIVYSASPNRYLQWDDGMEMAFLDSLGEVVNVFSTGDPRYVDIIDPPGGMLLEETDFTIVFPFIDNIKTLEVRDIKTQQFLAEIDLAETVRGFCQIYREDPQCVTYDSDQDSFPDIDDNCPSVPSQDQTDSDIDGVGNVCDNCPNDGNPNQDNFDGDTQGDMCDPDDDNDDICDPGESDPSCSGSDACPYDADNDIDADSLCADVDNCPNNHNPTQEDTYPPQGNGIGDACDCESDFNCDGNVDATDVTSFLADFGRSTFFYPCNNAVPCNGDFNCDENVDAADVTKFLEDFGRSQFFDPCPQCGVVNWCNYGPVEVHEVWVDDDWIGTIPGTVVEGHVFGTDAFDNIQDGIDAVTPPGMVYVAEGYYVENIAMRSGVGIDGSGPELTTIDGNASGTVVTANNVDEEAGLFGFTITNGASSGSGGGLYFYNSDPYMDRCIVKNNVAQTAGGMYNESSSPHMTNCIFINNTADLVGGMYNYDNSSPWITNCLFYGNEATINRSCIYNYVDSSPTLINSILWENIPGEIENGVSSLANVTYSDVQGGYAGTGNIDADPLFVNPASEDFHLLSGSPCRDAGTTAGMMYDMDFVSRPQGSAYDIGPYEYVD